MAHEPQESRIEREIVDREIVTDQGPSTRPEPSIGDLLKQLSTDTAELVRQQVELAKAELRQTGATLARDSSRLGLAFGLAFAGFLALTTFLIAGLARLLDGNVWLSALIVGVVFLAIGGVLARRAMADIKARGLVPDQTVASLRDDATWAKREAREVKRELTQ